MTRTQHMPSDCPHVSVRASLLAVLLSAALMATPSTAAFTETFARPAIAKTDVTSLQEPYTPFLWAVKGDLLSQGRGPVDPKESSNMMSMQDNMMMLGGQYYSPKPKAAQTVLLDWDGSNTSLQFFLMVHDTASISCDKAFPQVAVAWTSDNVTWQPLWNSSFDRVDTHQWIGVRVPLPLSAAAAPRFAVKWVNTDPGESLTHNACTAACIDDITFTAQPPTAANMGFGKPPGQLPADSDECKTCDKLCGLLLANQAIDKLTQESLGRFGGLSP
jgi:hypothetical protein